MSVRPTSKQFLCWWTVEGCGVARLATEQPPSPQAHRWRNTQQEQRNLKPQSNTFFNFLFFPRGNPLALASLAAAGITGVFVSMNEVGGTAFLAPWPVTALLTARPPASFPWQLQLPHCFFQRLILLQLLESQERNPNHKIQIKNIS